MTEHWPRWYILTGPWVIAALDISLTAWLYGSLTWANMIGMIDAAIWAYGMLVSLSEGALSIMFYAIAMEAKRRKKERKKLIRQVTQVAEQARNNPEDSIEAIVNKFLAEREK